MGPLGLIAWLPFAALAFGLPGLALQRLARTPIDPAQVVPLGTAWCAGTYWLSLRLDSPWLFPASLALAAVPLVLRAPWRRADSPSLRAAIPPALAVVVFLAVTQYPWNRLDSSGDFLLDPLVTFDSAFHVGLTHELVVGHPPQVPGVSGFPLGYHLGTDLVRAAALRWAGTDPWDSLTRFDVTLWAVALVLALRALAARLGAPRVAVALVPWTLLLTDFSFVFAGNPQAHWWTDLLRGNLLLSLAYANPIVPALGLAVGALVSLARYEETGARGHLALAALQSAAVPFFKVFLGAHLLLGLGAAWLLGRRAPRAGVLVVALPLAVATASLVLGQGGETVRVALAPLDLVRVTRETLGLLPLGRAGLLGWAALWLAASLGLRLLALPEAVRALRRSAAASALSVMALAGWPLGLLFRVSAPDVLPGQKVVNDAAYLVEQAGPLLWVFGALTLAGFATTPVRRALALAAVLLLATPATWQYVAKKATTAPGRLPAAMVRAVRALERVSRPGDVVMQRPGARYPPAPVVLAGRRVPYERFTPYLTQFASRRDLEARHEVVYRFFRTTSRDEALGIARSLGASFLALYGSDRVRFDVDGILEPIHEEEGARAYRIVDPGEAPGLSP
ncbi:MAG TPA: hypothetical protein VL691_23255 [Vicinamibacteria bacterium]|nr:hypothetical protein [Vicinamibacteria bacterium]